MACIELKIMRPHLIHLNRICNLKQDFGKLFYMLNNLMIHGLRFQKLLRDITKLLESNGSNIWGSADVQHLDRILGELKRSFATQVCTNCIYPSAF